MPLNAKAQKLLAELGESDPDFTFFGLCINQKTEEMGTFCSVPFEPGQILGFLEQGVEAMTDAARKGELQGADENGEYHASGERTQGSTIAVAGGSAIVH